MSCYEEEQSFKGQTFASKKCEISVDVFVYSKKECNEWKDELSSIPETAMNTGKEIDLG